MPPVDAAKAPPERFYSTLPEFAEFADVTRIENYSAPPESSLVVFTDVAGSTQAIEAGRYKDVNAIGVASIVAVCNAMRDVELPYVFGGDGAMLLVPASRRGAAERALRGVRAMAQSSFGLGVRAGIVPLAELISAGCDARVARFRLSAHSRLAMFSGDAWTVVDEWIKDDTQGARYAVSTRGESHADFDGFECRWEPVESQRGDTVSMIIRAVGARESDRKDTYRAFLGELERTTDGRVYHPIDARRLRLTGPLGDFSVEARVRALGTDERSQRRADWYARTRAFAGGMLMALRIAGPGFDGRTYRRDVLGNCDFRKFADALRLVVDLDRRETTQIEAWLAAEHAAGRLAYGMHRSGAALVTCLVRSHTGDHVHFVDGADGGYALAAARLKMQLDAQRQARAAAG